MKRLSEILQQIQHTVLSGNVSVEIKQVVFDSREVTPDSLFVACRGLHTDGHRYIEQALDKGAIAIICEDEKKTDARDVTIIKVKNASEALGHAVSNFYSRPSEQLKLVGVTGTNGKTTTVTLLYELFRKLGYKVGLLSTVSNYINDKQIAATHTTADAVQLNKLLAEMVTEGCEYCFMEVSSHAIDQSRISGLKFVGGIFTNITHDHLDYHKTFQDYLKAKQQFFTYLESDAFALVNKDDKNGMVMVQNSKAQKKSYALKSMADFKGKIIETHFDGLLMSINNKEIWSRLAGGFNVYNLLAVYATAVLLGQKEDEVSRVISQLTPVRGRFETVKSVGDITAIIDYAHTPDALENVIQSINQLRQTVGGRLICVVGAGGDRDKSKRPIMGQIASELSDKVIFTSDNPRSENPELIIEEIKQGVEIHNQKKVISIVNREEAIKTAFMLAEKGDIILVAGKGHETYQEINGSKQHFDDREIITRLFDAIS